MSATTTPDRQAVAHDEVTGGGVAEELVLVDPAGLVLGRNVRVDTHPDAREFAASIKARGVVEVITAYRDESAALVVLRGQRRAVVAAQVGTPTGTVPVRVVPAPSDRDRIIDQLGENAHRTPMHEREVRDALGQLSLLGVSVAQIARQTALPKDRVRIAVRVAASEAARAAMDERGVRVAASSG